MFRRTLVKLTLLNTIILFIIIGLLSASVYFYTKTVLYRSTDQSLLDAKGHFVDHVDHGGPRDPQIGMILWNSNSKFIMTNRDRLDPLTSSLKELKPKSLDIVVEQKVGDFYFRTLSSKMITNNGVVIVEFWTLVNAQKQVLQTLLMIIWVALIAGVLIAAGAGLFLAQRALKPIQIAWDRQQQFVSDASHEIRTPLTIIQSRIEMLLQTPQAKIQEKVNDISISLRETRRLSKLVSQLLTLARSDANQIELELAPLTLNPVLRQVFEQFEELAAYQDKQLTLNITEKPMAILGDKERIHQVLVIFLDNALKFTGEEGEITISGRQEGNTVMIEIKDNGIGIKSEYLPRVFDRFFQADPSRTDREGTGLGLSIAKWIMEKHRGRLSVDSTVGHGTKFTLSFPSLKANQKGKE
jgi:two-component system, OmpR family, sensor histidine kinase CiaH